MLYFIVEKHYCFLTRWYILTTIIEDVTGDEAQSSRRNLTDKNYFDLKGEQKFVTFFDYYHHLRVRRSSAVNDHIRPHHIP